MLSHKFYVEVSLLLIALTKILRPQHIFDQAKTVSVLVCPSTREACSILKRAKRFLPVPPKWCLGCNDAYVSEGLQCLKRAVSTNFVAFEIVPSWRSEESRVNAGHSLHQIYSEAVRTIVVCRWEQTEQVEVQRSSYARGGHGKMQSVVAVRCIRSWHELIAELGP